MVRLKEDIKGEQRGQKNINAHETAIFHNPWIHSFKAGRNKT
jgi:hypothetical protein